jgi:hypothetical protein
MRLFRRRGDEQSKTSRTAEVGLNAKDAAVLDQLERAGADLSQSRHVIYYSYAPSEDIGQAMRAEAEARGYAVEVRQPLPDFPDQWGVVCETQAVTSREAVRGADEFFQGLATRHGAEYDGWEASV